MYFTFVHSSLFDETIKSLFKKEKKPSLIQFFFQNAEVYLKFYSSRNRTKITDNKNTMYGWEAKSLFVY